MPETLFTIGREPELSVAELEAVAPSWGATLVDVMPAGVLLRHDQKLPDHVLDRLGGSIKEVDVLECLDVNIPVEQILVEHCDQTWLEKYFPEGRIEYGVSGYGLSQSERGKVQKHFLNLKKEVHAAGRPVRFVVSREPQLSAVTVQRNNLLKKGKEFVLFRTKQSLVLGVTTAVQDYRGYSRRDYGRPAADPKSGMIPPKLAQMMLNIAQVQPDDILLDPFCGSGTIIQEAALLGVKKMYGTDNDAVTVKNAQNNIRWLLKDFANINTDIELSRADARDVKFRPTVIVTEPYLGKPLRGHEPKSFLEDQKAELERMYLQCFQHWKNIMPKGGRVVMIWPEFVVGRNKVEINLDAAVAGLGFARARLLQSTTSALAFNIFDPLVLTYGRDDARVRRQVRKWTLTSPHA